MTASPTDPDFASAAAVVIDTQRDVLDGGGFPVAGTSAVVPAMRRVLEAFRSAGLPIVHVIRIYERDGTNAELCRRELLAGGMEVLVRDSPGSQIAGELLPQPDLILDPESLLAGRVQPFGPNEVAIYKPRWGAFYLTALDEYLQAKGVSTIVFMGCNFPNCPRTSIYEASERDFRIVVVRDAISGLYDQGARELVGIGVNLMQADELASVVRALQPLVVP